MLLSSLQLNTDNWVTVTLDDVVWEHLLPRTTSLITLRTSSRDANILLKTVPSFSPRNANPEGEMSCLRVWGVKVKYVNAIAKEKSLIVIKYITEANLK